MMSLTLSSFVKSEPDEPVIVVAEALIKPDSVVYVPVTSAAILVLVVPVS